MNKTLKTEELNLIRQWFNALEDLKGPGYFTPKDYELACKINLLVGWRTIPSEPDLDAPKYATGWVGGYAKLRSELVYQAGTIPAGQVIKILSAGMDGGVGAWLVFNFAGKRIKLRSKKEYFDSHLQWIGHGDLNE